MNKKDLEACAREAAKTLKTEEDFSDFRAMLTKVTVAAALNAELDDHLGYDKHEQSSLRVSLIHTSTPIHGVDVTSHTLPIRKFLRAKPINLVILLAHFICTAKSNYLPFVIRKRHQLYESE
jgi:hypothetical protein